MVHLDHGLKAGLAVRNGLDPSSRGNGLIPGRDGELGCSREVRLLDFRRSRASASGAAVLVDGFLCLVRVLSGVGLDGLGGLLGLLGRQIADLRGLLPSNVAGALKLSINGILVLDVHEGCKVGNAGGDKAQAPERDELDQEVRDQRREEDLK